MMLTSLPPGKKLEIKKTTHKKLATYLTELQKDGILKLETVSKGVERIAAVEFRVSFLHQTR